MSSTLDKTKTVIPTDGTSTPPIVVDFGKHKRKQVRQLRRGKGKLVDDISHTVDELRSAGTISASAQPVIIVVREKRGRKNLLSLLNV
jgi:hypothetical protein